MARPAVSSGRLKRRRRNRRLIVGGGVVAVLALIVAGFAWLSHASFLRITNVVVIGTQSLPTQALADYARQQIQGNYLFFFAKDNIFLYPRASIEAALTKQYPVLRQVDVHAKDFHTVEIAIAERAPAALWCDSSCSYMDETGLIYAPAPTFNNSPYVSYSGPVATTTDPNLRQYLTPPQFGSLAALVAALAGKEPDDPIGHVAVDDNLDVRVYFRDDFVLMFSLKDDGGDIFNRFDLALQSDAFKGKSLGDFEYLDLRFGDKLYYKAKSASN